MMSLSGTEIIYNEAASPQSPAPVMNDNRHHHQTQSSLSQTFINATQLIPFTNNNDGDNDDCKIIDINHLTLKDDIINNKMTSSQSTSYLQSLQSQSTEYNIPNKIYLNLNDQRSCHLTFPLYEQESEYNHIHIHIYIYIQTQLQMYQYHLKSMMMIV